MGIFSFDNVKIEEAPKDVVPKCPKCDTELDTVWIKFKGTGIIEQKQIIMCPHCRALLGFGHSLHKNLDVISGIAPAC